ncbi:LEA type 2 family protein [Spirosoma sp. KUDC1026]|uniref:LEA type 2 family protein n=1 Tax=Spirosoma sp. KUDC1026 TaxID=2745947 RepID=UPI00159B983B|nr:LEA type 2 family protein [Spirosoma sp. KUDC1026]QKZ15295.1 LEA type 2 family protein [Spirosoma sp. KUDC1026]
MKKGWMIALGVVLLLIVAIATYVWYTGTQQENGAYYGTLKPRLEMSTVDITNIDDDQIDMMMKLLVDNPLPVGFKASKLRYTVYIARTPVVEEIYEKPIEVKSGDSTVIALPAKLLISKLNTVLKTLEEKGIDSTTYGVRAVFDLDVPVLGERTFTQSFETKRPTIYVPKIKVEDVDFGKLGLKQTDVAAKVNVQNKNVFPLTIADTRYTVSIDGKEIADGYQPDPIRIKQQATTPVVFPVTVKPGQTLGLLPKMLFDKKDTPFTVTFHCKLISKDGDPSFNESKMNATIRGTLADFKKD